MLRSILWGPQSETIKFKNNDNLIQNNNNFSFLNDRSLNRFAIGT